MMLNHPLPPNVLAALQRGNTLEAIKLLRESRQIGLKEAKDLIDHQVHGGRPSIARSGSTGSPLSLFLALITALVNQDKTEALRLLRERTGLDIQEARKALDALPFKGMSPQSDLAPGEVPRSNGTVWLIVLLVIAYIAYQILVVPD